MLQLTILGIETSCDETAASIYTTKYGVKSNVLYSQIDIHKIYGGVVPELAAKSHLEKIDLIVNEALNKAKITLKDINVIAVTNRPGLPGSLLVGVCFAKAVAWAAQKKIIGINHLEGHIFSACIENTIPFPFICLTASGGHTALYKVNNYGSYELLGQTLDDAAGEAFDKISKLISLGYPGGPQIEKLAFEADFQDFFYYPRAMSHSFDFSFSGLKTAVIYDLVKQGAYNLKEKKFLKDTDISLKQRVSSSLLVCITDIFEEKLLLAFKKFPEIKAVAFVGGVASNSYIRKRLQTFCKNNNKLFFTPSKEYCTDNGAMIAFVGHYKAQKGEFSDFTLDIK